MYYSLHMEFVPFLLLLTIHILDCKHSFLAFTMSSNYQYKSLHFLTPSLFFGNVSLHTSLIAASLDWAIIYFAPLISTLSNSQSKTTINSGTNSHHLVLQWVSSSILLWIIICIMFIIGVHYIIMVTRLRWQLFFDILQPWCSVHLIHLQ